jgi:uncharacterized protein YjiS (DUF1127 family)
MSTRLQERHPSIGAAKIPDRAPARRAPPRVSARQAPAAVPNRAIEAPRARWRLILASIVATLREWRRRSMQRHDLLGLDAHILRDVGIDPGVVEFEMRQPFWRPLRDWRD